MPSQELSATDLLHGAAYAMEQGGCLVRDAVELWNAGRYSSAVILAVFAREEIGRAKIYLKERRRALASGPVPLDRVRGLCKEHVDKLAHGSTGVSLRFGPDDTSARGLFSDPRSEDYKAARAATDDLVKRMAKRQPHDAHAQRCRALYVDASDVGWNRPSLTSRVESRELLEDVANDYAMRLDFWRGGGGDMEVATPLQAWTDRPLLPDPVWPQP